MLLSSFLYNLYIKFIPNYFNFLKKRLKDSKSVLELGCGNNSPLQYFPKNYYACGVDIFLPSLRESRSKHIHNSYISADVLTLCIKPKSFDCVIALDVIEHLEKDDGYRLIESMKTIAREKIIIFTPNGFVKQCPYEGNVYHLHKSGWFYDDFKKLGFFAFGFFGLKYLRGEQAKLKYWPRFFWFIISELLQPLVFKIPKLAAQILYIKEL